MANFLVMSAVEGFIGRLVGRSLRSHWSLSQFLTKHEEEYVILGPIYARKVLKG